MQVLSDPQRLLNFNPFVIYFTLSAKAHPDVKKALLLLNKHQEFTRGIFRFETVERSLSDNDETETKLIKTINRYNMIAKLVDDYVDDYKYAVGKLNFNLGYDEVEWTIQGFINEVCKLNVTIFEIYLNDQITTEQRANLMQMRQMFLDAISMKTYRHGIWAKLMGADPIQTAGPTSSRRNDRFEREVTPETKEKLRKIGKNGDIEYILSWCQDFFGTPDKRTSDKIAKDYYSRNYAYVKRGNRIESKPDVVPEITIEIRKIVTKTYKKDRKKYGYIIFITVNGHVFPISFGGKDQQMLFMCTLLRKKLGEKLYRHEFFNNERGNSADTRFKRANSAIWFNMAYNTFYNNPARSFDQWIAGIRRGAGHNLDQAKSRTTAKIKESVSQPSALYYCTLVTKEDLLGDTFYDIRIGPQNIIIPDELQPLLDDFYDIMQVDKPE